MREMKFRAWDGKEMKLAFDLSQNPKYWWEGNKDFPLMQYTGLKDKDGAEIYEGDIVKRTYESGSVYIGEVIFEEATYFMRNNEEYAFLPNQYDGESLEVIGNIYESPELLEVDE